MRKRENQRSENSSNLPEVTQQAVEPKLKSRPNSLNFVQLYENLINNSITRKLLTLVK